MDFQTGFKNFKICIMLIRVLKRQLEKNENRLEFCSINNFTSLFGDTHAYDV